MYTRLVVFDLNDAVIEPGKANFGLCMFGLLAGHGIKKSCGNNPCLYQMECGLMVQGAWRMQYARETNSPCAEEVSLASGYFEGFSWEFSDVYAAKKTA